MSELVNKLRKVAYSAVNREYYTGNDVTLLFEAADRLAELESKLSAKKGEALFHKERTVYLENRIAALEAANAELLRRFICAECGHIDWFRCGECGADMPGTLDADSSLISALRADGDEED